MDDFLLRALTAGLVVATVAGPLGCFVVWRRMAFFGATIAHSALLGIGLGFALGIDLTVGLFAVGAVIAVLLVAAERERTLATDTILSILAHSALAAGLIVLGFLEAFRVDLMGYLFGDILAVGPHDLWLIGGGGGAALAVLIALWRPLLAVTIHEEIAAVEGVPVLAMRIVFMLLLALVVAIALKVVGILLVTSLLVIPAAAARRFAGTPERMAVIAVAIGWVSVLGGLAASWRWDMPAGAAIVVAAAMVFIAASVVPAGLAFRR